MRTRNTVLALTAAVGLGAMAGHAPAGDAIVVYSAGIDGMLDNPKDAALHAALVRMEQNGLSLPPDTSPRDTAVANLIAGVLMSEVDVRMKMDPAAAHAGMPFGLSITSRGNAGMSADELMKRLRHVMDVTGAPTAVPSEVHPGLWAFPPDISSPPATFGVEDDRAVLGLNCPPETGPIDWSGCGLPWNVDPIFGLIVDFDQLQPLLGMAAMFNPQAAGMMSSFGLMGPDAIRMEFAMGRGRAEMHVGGRITNYGKHFGDLLVSGGIRPDVLEVVPKDALDVQASSLDLAKSMDQMLMMADDMSPPMGEGPDGTPAKASDLVREQVKMMLGVDPKTDLIDHLGDAMVLYRSNATGGGGLMSGVMGLKLSNADAMATSLGALATRINAMAAPMSQGYVQLSTWAEPDCGEVISLLFPGVPVPFELSFVVKGDWLLAALTPQALVAACRQVDGTSSIMDNPRFAAAVGSKAIGAVQVNFTDVPAQLADGYGIAVGLMNAISNYTTPRADAASGVRMLLPPYADLSSGARPCVVIAEADGDDLIYRGTADSSMNVLVTGAAANVSAMMPLVAAMAAGVALPAVEEARDRARRMERKAREHAEKTERSRDKESHGHADHDHYGDGSHEHNREGGK
ncbi:MAG: hypothetical protein QF733_03450 [Phycisphaerales bacterium]|nr:hypothetical protein [Phycisphaerales bacterium]